MRPTPSLLSKSRRANFENMVCPLWAAVRPLPSQRSRCHTLSAAAITVAAIGRIPRGLVVGSQWLLVLLLFPLYLAMEDVVYWAHVIRVLFVPTYEAFHAYHLLNFEAVFLVLFVPIGLAGALLPLLFHELRREVRELGSVAGRLSPVRCSARESQSARCPRRSRAGASSRCSRSRS